MVAVQGGLGTVFLAYTVFASNPLARRRQPPVEGRSLNPLLQDPALAVHPPFLYAGYVGMSVVFSLAVAALIEGRVDAAWARWVAALGAGRLEPAHGRHHAGLVLGLLRAGLGRLVVLGPGGERLLHALAGRHGPAALGDRHREARRAGGLDAVPVAGRLLASRCWARSWCARAC